MRLLAMTLALIVLTGCSVKYEYIDPYSVKNYENVIKEEVRECHRIIKGWHKGAAMQWEVDSCMKDKGYIRR